MLSVFVELTEQITNKNKNKNKQTTMKHWSLLKFEFAPLIGHLQHDDNPYSVKLVSCDNKHLKCTHNTVACQIQWAW